jgi:hypothetical protein
LCKSKSNLLNERASLLRGMLFSFNISLAPFLVEN